MDVNDIIDGKRAQSGQPSVELRVFSENFANSLFQISVACELFIKAYAQELLDGHPAPAGDSFGFLCDIVWKLKFESFHDRLPYPG